MALPNRLRLRAGAVAGVVGLALIVAACGSSSSSSPSASSAAASPSNAGGAVTLSTAKGSGGVYLTGASGRALYLWVADKADKSSCSGACAQAWPPLLTKSAPATSGAVKSSDIGTITRSNGTKQVTYKGHPLYYFIGDQSSGTTSGQGSNGFGAKWWLVSPAGAAITAHSSATAASSGY